MQLARHRVQLPHAAQTDLLCRDVHRSLRAAVFRRDPVRVSVRVVLTQPRGKQPRLQGVQLVDIVPQQRVDEARVAVLRRAAPAGRRVSASARAASARRAAARGPRRALSVVLCSTPSLTLSVKMLMGTVTSMLKCASSSCSSWYVSATTPPLADLSCIVHAPVCAGARGRVNSVQPRGPRGP